MSNLIYIIGGSASTGSSLLSHYLGNHSKIYSGPETNLLTHPQWMTDWEQAKGRITQSTLENIISSGWHIHKGIQYDHLSDSNKILEFIEKSSRFADFIGSIFQNVASDKYYIEKTPSNSPYFHLLRSHFKDAQQILTVRNPYDAIASMRRRGWSIPYAAGLYLFNISLGYHRDTLVVKYKDLINAPSVTLQKILDSRQLKFETKMLDNELSDQIDSWVQVKQNTGQSTFELMSQKEQKLIHYFISHLRFRADFDFWGNQPFFRGITDIIHHLSYELRDSNSIARKPIRARYDLYLENCKRLLRNYPLAGNSFPFELIP